MTIAHIGNNLYLGVAADTKPTTVPDGSIFITIDTRRFYIWNLTTWDELAYVSTGASDLKALVLEAGAVIGAGLGRSLNFPVTSDFDITEDTGNDEYDIKIADGAIADNHILEHTTTKISIDQKARLPSTIVYTDQSNTFNASNVYSTGNTFGAENVFQVQQRQNRQTTPTDPPADTGVRYLIQVDTDNDSFADKVKIGGVFVEVRDF